MVILNWLSHNWFDFLQSLGIIGSLFFAAYTLRVDAKARRISNKFAATDHHWNIWKQLYQKPELSRILESKVNVTEDPVQDDEEVFVLQLILHLKSVYQAIISGMYLKPSELEKDIHAFFSLPIPKSVWQKWKPLQDRDFADFVESCLNG